MNKIFDSETRNTIIDRCFKYCINSFEEKPLNPYEKECIGPCLEN